MSKTWKWILGIVLGLVILFGIGFVAARFFGFGHMSFGSYSYYRHPMMDNDYGFSGRAPMDGYRDFRHPMVSNYGYMSWPFLFFGGFLRLLFPLLVLGAVVYFSYKKGKKDGMAAATVVSVPEPEVEPVVEEE